MHQFQESDELRVLLDALCEETITAEQMRRLEELVLGHPVFLELQVKVRPRWRRDEALLERLGI